jgi:hypothetical protein
LNLVRPWVNHREQLSFLNFLTFLDGDFNKLAVYAALDRNRVRGLNGAQAGEDHGHVLFLYWSHRNRDRLLAAVSLAGWFLCDAAGTSG